MLLHIEGLVQTRAVQQERQQEKGYPGLQDADYYPLQDVFFPVVPDFVSQYRDQFGHGVFFNQGIEQSDSLVTAKPAEEGI